MRSAWLWAVLAGCLVGCGGGGDGREADVLLQSQATALTFGTFPSASVVMGQTDFGDGDANRGDVPLPDTLAGPLGPLAVGPELATYQLAVVNAWSTTSHPGQFPDEAHFSWLGGGTHDASVSLWAVGELASPGMVQMAESGVTRLLTEEIQAEMERGHAFGTLDWRWWFCPDETVHAGCGVTTVLMDVSEAFPLVTLLTMLGPSPDWFVGVDGLPLRDGNGWIDEVVVPLVSYDGGTRSANVWDVGGPLDDPPQPITLVTADTGQLIGPDPIGSMTFTRLGGASPPPVYVADTMNNRVLGYVALPTANTPPGVFALGQPDVTTVAPGTGAEGLREPTTVAIGSGKLAVADRANHRVLVWAAPPTGDGAAADLVVGQANMDAGTPALDASSLNLPTGVALADGRLFVADTGNNRVLVWNTLPLEDGAAADLVLGQTDFDSGAPAAGSGMNGPCAVWTDGVRLIVADSGNHRVLIWDELPTENGQAPDAVVGQPDVLTAIPGAGAEGLNSPCGVCADAEQLYVADTGNHRVMIYRLPTSNGAAAGQVLGQSNFSLVSANDDAQVGAAGATPSARTLRGPTGISVRGSQLVVMDAGNSRALVFDALDE